MISWFARFKNRFGKLEQFIKKGLEKAMLQSLQNRRKRHPKWIPNPSKKRYRIYVEFQRRFPRQAGEERASTCHADEFTPPRGGRGGAPPPVSGKQMAHMPRPTRGTSGRRLIY